MSDDIEEYKQLFKNIKESVKVARSKTTDPTILEILDDIEENAEKVKL